MKLFLFLQDDTMQKTLVNILREYLCNSNLYYTGSIPDTVTR